MTVDRSRGVGRHALSPATNRIKTDELPPGGLDTPEKDGRNDSAASSGNRPAGLCVCMCVCARGCACAHIYDILSTKLLILLKKLGPWGTIILGSKTSKDTLRVKIWFYCKVEVKTGLVGMVGVGSWVRVLDCVGL